MALFSTVAEIDGEMIRLRASSTGSLKSRWRSLAGVRARIAVRHGDPASARAIHIPDADAILDFRRFLVGRGYQVIWRCP